MCPHFRRTVNHQCATTNLTFIRTRFHWHFFGGPHPIYFVLSEAYAISGWSNFHHRLPYPVEAHCEEKYSGMQGQGMKSFLQSFIATERALGKNTPRGAAAKLSQSGTAQYAPAELLQAQGQVWRTTWLIFLLWMRTALPALCFLHGTEACYMFFMTPRALHVCHVFRTSLIKRRKEDSHLWWSYFPF